MWEIIAWPFGKILWLCYLLVKNYGVALLLFTIIIKLIMLPSAVKQQMSMARMSRLNPKLEQLKKKYANNKEKLNEATMELYNQENVNPMGSCLPMVVTFVVLFAIIEVVYAPLSYISNVPKDKLAQAQNNVYDAYVMSTVLSDHQTSVEAILENGEASVYETLLSFKSEEKSALADYSDERIETIASVFEANPDLDQYMIDDTKVSKRLISGNTNRAQLVLMSVAVDYPDLFDQEVVDVCRELDYTFLGVYLGAYPSWSSVLVLIPILSLVSQLALTFISQYFQKKNGANAAAANKSMNVMLYTMPLISFWIAFSFPAGIGIYWIFSSVVSLLQTVGLNLYLTPARTEKLLAKQDKKARKKPSLYQMALEKQKEQLGVKYQGEEALDEAMTEEVKLSRAEKKEAQRMALNEAKRRYVDKYGDGEASPEDEAALEAARQRYYAKYGDSGATLFNSDITTEENDS